MSYPFRARYHQARKALQGTIDTCWPSARFNDHLTSIYHKPFDKEILPIPENMSTEARLWLENWNDKPEQETLYETNALCTVDPKFGLLFSKGKVIWSTSDKPDRERNPRFFNHLGRCNCKLPAAILLHHLHGDNYFHFINRIMSKLYVVEIEGLDKEIPLLINQKAAETPFFRQAQNLGVFEGRQIIIQGNKEIIEVGKAFVPRPADYQRHTIEWVAKQFTSKIERKQGSPIFALRQNNAANGRVYRNQDEVSRLATQLGFNVLDPGTLSLKEQIETFYGAPAVVGAHGAALTNIVYRAEQNGHLLELFSPSMGSPHYYMISDALGFDYEATLTMDPIGRAFTASTTVDMHDLKGRLERIADAAIS